MAFNNRFGNPSNGNVPQGVNIEHTSFGYNQNKQPYTKPTFQKETINTQKTKPRGGWDDDEDDGGVPQIKGGSGTFKGNQTNQPQNIAQSPASANTGGGDFGGAPTSKKGNPAIDYELIYCDEKFVSEHEFENRTINDLIQPGGARIKQPDNLLNQFCSASESFQAAAVSSLLLSKLGEDIPFVSKARTLFLIEAVVKKVKKYFDYFNYNINTLKEIDFSDGSNEGNQLNKIVGDIIKYIENPNKTKIIPTYTPTPVTGNILDDPSNDLLGNSPVKGKQDPFGFIKKTPSDSTQNQPFSNQSNNQQSFELLDDPTGAQQGGFQQQQQQAQPKKFNPFDIGVTTTVQPHNTQQGGFQNVQNQQQQQQPQTTGKPSLNFKKFQQQPGTSGNTNQNSNSATPTNLLDSKFDQLEDLLASDLNLGSNEPVSKPSSNQNQGNQQGFGNQPNYQNQQQQGGPSQQQQQQKQSFPPQNQGFNQQQTGGFQGGQQQQQQNLPYPQQNQGFNQQAGGFPGGQQGQQKPTGPGQQTQFNQQGGFPQYGGQGGFGGPGGFPQQGYGGYPYPQQQQQGFQQGYYGQQPQYGYGQQQGFYGQNQGQFGGQQNFGGNNFQQQQPGYGQNMQGNQQWQQQQQGGFGKK